MRHLEKGQFRFLLTREQIQTIASQFRQAMSDGLHGMDSSLKMLPSFLDIPREILAGTIAAVDFGGSHIRALEVRLVNGQADILAYRKQGFPVAGTPDELFGAVAALVREVVTTAEYLGHTFSFPCRQQDVNTARLIAWTKEVTTPGVEGQDINRLLEQALQKQGINIRPAAILNDTVGTLLAAAYRYPEADIAAICGTGHNTCYVEPVSPVTGQPMIINMESGNFGKLPFTAFDELVDAQSDRPGQQRLEKMVAGRYLGELARLVILELSRQGSLSAEVPFFQRAYALTAEDIAGWVEQRNLNLWLQQHNVQPWEEKQCSQVTAVCRDLFLRSAQLAAATFLGVLLHIDPDLEQNHIIAIDGSLYEKAPGYADQIDAVIKQMLGNKSERIEIKLVKDGSGVGAAIAAAIASKGVG